MPNKPIVADLHGFYNNPPARAKIYKGATGYWVVKCHGSTWYLPKWKDAISTAIGALITKGHYREAYKRPPHLWKYPPPDERVDTGTLG